MDEGSSASPPRLVSVPPAKAIEWLRQMVCLSLIFLGLCVIAKLGTRLYDELQALRGDWADARDRAAMGYVGISSEFPERQPPSCVRKGEGYVYLWAGSGVKGQEGWFDVTEIDQTVYPLFQFTFAMGRDRKKTIDYPIFQPPDGEIVRRIYPERPVFGLVYDGVARAYPLTVLEKVEVVNETFGDRAIAVTYCPLIEQAAVYERSLDGMPISLGTSGYCHRNAFVLYDRGTDSLWHPTAKGLTAISGPLRGKVLPALEQPERTAWGEWRRRYPRTQVLVGADRSHGIPLPPPSEMANRPL